MRIIQIGLDQLERFSFTKKPPNLTECSFQSAKDARWILQEVNRCREYRDNSRTWPLRSKDAARLALEKAFLCSHRTQ